jgi:ATP-binding cassette subfamily F protein 3
MSLLTASHLTKSFGPDDIFTDISLNIPQRARIAIVGPNGIGKTTLLRILAGLDSPTDGHVSRMRNLKSGYLPQEAPVDAKHTLWDECLSPFEDLRTQELELAQLEASMADPNIVDVAMVRYGSLQAEFELMGGYTYITRIKQVLSGLGFDEGEYDFPMTQLSGGERTRALLARLLLSEPDLLIMDEPTNHLDIQAVEWLEAYLNQWEGAVLIVSHDRYFLDKVVDTIWEMSWNGFEVYKGNYSAYVHQRQGRWERRRDVFESEKERVEKDIEYIKRNIAGQNVAQARGRLRRLSRYLQAVEQVGMEAVVGKRWGEVSENVTITVGVMSVDEAERRMRALRKPSNRPRELHLRIKPKQRSGNIVMRPHDLEIGYPGFMLFRVGDIELRRLECAALIGPNGSGKTTFLKTVLEQVPPQKGEVNLGASLEIGYFAQAHEDLNIENTLIEEIESVAPRMLPADIRNHLARFLFTKDEVFKKVSVLSGGERGRLALAKLALTNANLLLLDEPTNHLDIPAQEILQNVLADYQGTILLVSHDRYLIDALGTQIWEVDEGKRALLVYKGTYSEYREYKEAQREARKATASASSKRKRAERKSLSKSEERRRIARLEEVESLIAGLEENLVVLSRRLENPPSDSLKVQRLGNDYVRVQKELDDLMQEWEELHID